MTPKEILHQLLEQHAHLRELLGDARAYAELCSRGGGQPGTLKGWLVTVVDAVRTHNRDEERLVGEVLPSLDEWGERGVTFMSAEHAREHSELYDALLGASEDEDTARAGHIALATIERIRAHMATEERLFLRPDVLRDRDKVSG